MLGLGPGLMGLIASVFILLPFAFVAFIMWLAVRLKRNRQEKHVEVQKEIIGKFSSSAEMELFLKSDEGRKLFKDLHERPSRSLRERAIARIGIGIVLVVVGAGLMVLAHEADQPQILVSRLDSAVPQPAPGNIPNAQAAPQGPLLEIPPGMGLPAAALFLTGVGLIISSIVVLKLSPNGNSDS